MEEETPKTDFYHQDTETTVDGETGEETVVNVGDPYLVAYTVDPTPVTPSRV